MKCLIARSEIMQPTTVTSRVRTHEKNPETPPAQNDTVRL